MAQGERREGLIPLPSLGSAINWPKKMSRDRRGQSWTECLMVFHTSPLPCIQDLLLAECLGLKIPSLRKRRQLIHLRLTTLWNPSLLQVSHEYLNQGWCWFSPASCSQQAFYSEYLHPNWLCRRIAHCRASAVLHSAETFASISDPQ